MMYFVITFKNNGYGSQKTVMRQSRDERNFVEVLTTEGFRRVTRLPDFDCQALSVPDRSQLLALGVQFA
jgi:hypothetical protein